MTAREGLDTRERIISLAEVTDATAEGQWVIVNGLFDPLTAAEASRIAQVARDYPGTRLLAAVLDSRSALLPVQARCTLVAALRQVHAVVAACPAQLRETLHSNDARFCFLNEIEAGEQRSQEFVDMVIARQQGSPA